MKIKTSNKNWIGLIILVAFVEAGAFLGYTSHSQAAITVVVAFLLFHVVFGLGVITREIRVTDSLIEVDYFRSTKSLDLNDLKEVRITSDSILFRATKGTIVIPRSVISKQALVSLVTPFKDIVVEKNGSKYI